MELLNTTAVPVVHIPGLYVVHWKDLNQKFEKPEKKPHAHACKANCKDTQKR